MADQVTLPVDPVDRLEYVGRELFGSRWKLAMAEAMGVSREAVHLWLRGKARPPLDLDRRINMAIESVIADKARAEALHREVRKLAAVSDY